MSCIRVAGRSTLVARRRQLPLTSSAGPNQGEESLELRKVAVAARMVDLDRDVHDIARSSGYMSFR